MLDVLSDHIATEENICYCLSMSDQNQFCSDTTATHILYYALNLACTN